MLPSHGIQERKVYYLVLSSWWWRHRRLVRIFASLWSYFILLLVHWAECLKCLLVMMSDITMVTNEKASSNQMLSIERAEWKRHDVWLSLWKFKNSFNCTRWFFNEFLLNFRRKTIRNQFRSNVLFDNRQVMLASNMYWYRVGRSEWWRCVDVLYLQ